MPTEDFPKHVADFLVGNIDSVIQLEALLLLHARRDASWQAEDVARELRIDPEWTEAALAKLTAAGILQHQETDGGTYRYAPRTADIDRTVSELAKTYGERRVSVISLIFSKPPPDPIRQFTDAFRFRKDDSGPRT